MLKWRPTSRTLRWDSREVLFKKEYFVLIKKQTESIFLGSFSASGSPVVAISANLNKFETFKFLKLCMNPVLQKIIEIHFYIRVSKFFPYTLYLSNKFADFFFRRELLSHMNKFFINFYNIFE